MTNVVPIIATEWTLAMMICGGLGLLLHIAFSFNTIRYYISGELDSTGKIFIIGCILVFILNGFACFMWLFLRTSIAFELTHTLCAAIYSSNFLFYFLGKYSLHLLYIYRIYVIFRGSTYEMSKTHLYLFSSITTINFFIATAFWTYFVVPSVLVGNWYFHQSTYEICTLFSDDASHTFEVKAAAISIGLEDFLIGTITLYVFLKRFGRIGTYSHDIKLLYGSIKFGVVAAFSVISTLFLFTLAVPFYPNVTFVIAVDATINSICLFCVLSIGSNLYTFLCYPCHCCGHKYVEYQQEKQANSTITEISSHASTLDVIVGNIRQLMGKKIDEAELSGYIERNKISCKSGLEKQQNGDAKPTQNVDAKPTQIKIAAK